MTAPILDNILKTRTDPARLWALLRRWRRLPAAATDHAAVMAHLELEGGISARFCVLTVLSCGIAVLGLLLSSAAVVIGAMLISPLMSPIILFGFSLATLDYRLAARSLKAIALGTTLAIIQAAVIVWLSPLNSVTPEILARTRPNFFDLLVAIFSAIAGAYAVARRRGETIVGVAIATALMPPLAVIGYGLAVQNWAIFAGAGGLFMTNLLAIGLTASLVAKFFGFGFHKASQIETWQTLGIVAVFAVLSIPLGLSLKQLAGEALLTARLRNVLNAEFRPPEDHVYGMNIAFPDNQPIQVEALVLSRKVRPDLEVEVQRRLAAALRKPVSLTLSQVPLHQRESLDRQAIEELVSRSNANLSRQMKADSIDMGEIAAAEAGVPVLQVSAARTERQVVVRAAEAGPAQLASLRAADAKLRARYPGWHFSIQVNDAALPAIAFPPGDTSLDAQNGALLDNIAWALKEDGVKAVRVVGYSDSSGHAAADRRIALKRARAVAQALGAAGLTATALSNFPAPGQTREERERGHAAFRQVRIEAAQP